MGLFSSKTKIQVFSVAMDMTEEETDTIKETVYYSIMQNTDIAENLRNAALKGMASKVSSMYSYARDKFKYGLPVGSIGGVSPASQSKIKEIIEAEIGQDVYVEYSFIESLTMEMLSMEYLVDTRGYDDSTGEISSHNFTLTPSHDGSIYPVILDSFTLVNSKKYTINYTHKYTTLDSTDGSIVDNTELFSEDVVIQEGTHIGSAYYLAQYYITDSSGNPVSGAKIWTYDVSTNVYPELSFNIEPEETPFLPIVPIRYNNSDLTDDSLKDTDEYITSKDTLSKVGIDIDSVAESLNENPDIDAIDNAYVMFGINLHSNVQTDLKYLAEFFDYVNDIALYNEHDHSSTQSSNVIDINYNAPYSESLKIRITFAYITSSFESGSIGTKGFVKSNTVLNTAPPSLEPDNPFFSSGETPNGNNNVSYVEFKRQESSDNIKVIRVYGLIHTNVVYNGISVTTNISDSMDEDNNNFIIPVSYIVCSRLPIMTRNDVYYRSFKIVVNSIEITKVKWYQRGWFKALVSLIGIVISVVSFQYWVAGLFAAVATSASAAITYVVTTIVVSVAVGEITTLIAEEIGVLASILVTLALSFAGKSLKFFDLDFMLMQNKIMDLTFADALLQLSNGILSGASSALEIEQEELLEDTSEFNDYMEEKELILSDAEDLLDTNSNLNPMKYVYKQVQSSYNESPTNYYNRAIHIGNIGTLAYDVLHNYHDLMLELPSST